MTTKIDIIKGTLLPTLLEAFKELEDEDKDELLDYCQDIIYDGKERELTTLQDILLEQEKKDRRNQFMDR